MASGARDTICALATPAGEGAIGVLRLSGPRAVEIVSTLSRGATLRPRRARLMTLFDPGSRETLDQVVACLFRRPRSYTGEDVVELSAHGGQLNLVQLLEQLVALGARPAEPGEFTRRAFVNGRIDLTQAEAVAELIAARSERALHNARAMLGGELGRRVRDLREGGISLLADLEACIDFADELEAPVSAASLGEQLSALSSGVGALAGSYLVGRRLGGVSLALIGEVNVGKSSLFNALLGSERALVSAEEGTTRDYLEAEVNWDGHRLTLIDMAGSRPAAAMSSLEREGQRLGSTRLGSVDAAIVIVDAEAGSQGRYPGFEGISIVAANKIDRLDQALLARRISEIEGRVGGEVQAISALKGLGLEGLRSAVVEALFGAASSGLAQDETVAVTQQRQYQALQRAEQALQQGRHALQHGLAAELLAEHLRQALEALAEISGESYDEDLLDCVFARFCIGK